MATKNNNKPKPENKNKNNKGVLDSSALRTLFFNEEGATKVYKILEDALVSTISLSTFLDEVDGAGGPTNLILKHIQTLALQFAPFDYDQVCIASRYSSLSLSLECRAAIALALSSQAPLYTTNKALATMDLPITICLIH